MDDPSRSHAAYGFVLHKSSFHRGAYLGIGRLRFCVGPPVRTRASDRNRRARLFRNVVVVE